MVLISQRTIQDCYNTHGNFEGILGRWVRASVGVDRLVRAARGRHVGVRAKVDEEIPVSCRIGAYEPSLHARRRLVSDQHTKPARNTPYRNSTYVVLRPSDGRAAPSDGVAGPDKAARRRRRRLPRDLELHDRRIRAGLDVGVEEATGDDLLELAACDDELRGVGGGTEDGVAGRTLDLGAEVLVEVGVLLCGATIGS